MGSKYCIYRGCWGCEDNCNGRNNCPRFTLDWETLTDVQQAIILSILDNTDSIHREVKDFFNWEVNENDGS